MNKKVDAWIDTNRDSLVATLQGCLRINTVRDDSSAAPGAPFGRGIADCLRYSLKAAADMGFDTKDLDGYCGVIDYGSGEEQLGILAHLDVVPEGNGWKYPPYAAEIHDGMIYARGSLDDKGSAIASLFALKAIKEAGLPMKRRVRIILGCDEESGMGCLTHYNEVEKAPDLSFSPDAEYPLVNSEKLIYRSEYKKDYASTIKLHAGTVANAVPGECECEVELPLARILPIMEAVMEKSDFSCAAEANGDGTLIKMKGLAAHASAPESGRNAFLATVALLDKLPLAKADAETVSGLAEILKFDMHGESFGIDSEDASGRLTLNVGVVDWDETGIKRLTVDIRAPITGDGEFITKKLAEGFMKAGLKETDHHWSDGYYMPPESELVSSLLKVYSERFNITDPKPLAIGGGTYARHLKNAVAFGPERPGEPACIHMANECVSIDHLVEDAKLIADAIIALACK